MKNYEEVVKNRYDAEDYSIKGAWSNPYALVNKIGCYGYLNIVQELQHFINSVKCNNIETKKILDVGCGDGSKTRLLAEMVDSPENVFGMEYSKARLEIFKKKNPAIICKYGDLVKDIPYKEKFYAITAFAVLMHMKTAEELESALSNIYNSLETGGYFLWYDPNSYDHFSREGDNSDGEGFSVKQMKWYADKVGFKFIYKRGIYRQLPGNRNTLYYIDKVHSSTFLKVLEKLLVVFPYGYNVCLFKKC